MPLSDGGPGTTISSRFLENSPMGILLYRLNDRDELILHYTNPATDKILGFQLLPCWGQTLEQVFPMVHETGLAPIYKKIAEEGGTYQREDLSYHDDKISGAFDLLAFQVNPREMAVYFSDITERKHNRVKLEERNRELARAETALKKSEIQFRSLFHNMVLAFALHEILLDETGRPVDYVFLDVNPAFESQTGLKAVDILGKRVLEVLPGTEPYWIETYGQVALTGNPVHMEHLSGVLGRHYDVVAYSPQKGQFAVVFQDVTERYRAAEEKDSFLHALNAKNEEMESLLYVASHDLRSPLVNIQGFSARLEKQASQLRSLLSEAAPLPLPVLTLLDQKIPAALSYIQESSRKMDRLIKGILRISRLGSETFTFERISGAQLLEGIRQSLAHQIESAGAVLRVGALPDFWGDFGQMEQVFSNLIDNALKYRSPSRACVIKVEGFVEGSAAVYSVQDNGPGIPESQQDKVWSLFYRIHPEGGVIGEGLGLTAVKRIVDRHNGQIRMVSDGAMGTEFILSLPLSPTSRPPKPL